MRKLLSAFILSVFITASAQAAGVLMTGEDAKKVENILSWSVFNPQGEGKNGKAVYIFGGLKCGFTARVINRSPEIDKEVQIRWVFPESYYSIPGTGFVMTEKLPEAFTAISDGKRQEDRDSMRKIAAGNLMIQAAIDAVGYDGGYPTIIYKTDKGIRLTPVLDDVIADMNAIQPFQFYENRGKEYWENKENLGKQVKAENTSKEFMHAYLFPDVESPCLDKFNYGLPPGYYSYSTCYEYPSDQEFFACRMSDPKTLFYLKKNK